jgi:hypothetical protein
MADGAAGSAEAVGARLLDLWQAGELPDIAAMDTPALVAGIDSLILRGAFDAGMAAARALAARLPDHPYPRGLLPVLEAMPPAEGTGAFADDPAADVQVVARPGAETLVLVFCGVQGRMGGPLALVHRWLGTLPASIAYLRDFSGDFFIGGIRSLGPRPQTVAALGRLAASLGARRIACCGNSAGVFAALHYGVELGAGSVVGFAGPTNLSAAFNAHLRLAAWTREAEARGLTAGIDLRAAYAAAPRPPQALLVFGAENWDDRIQAEHMAGLSTVRLAKMARYPGHNVVTTLMRTGRLGQVLDHLVAPAG